MPALQSWPTQSWQRLAASLFCQVFSRVVQMKNVLGGMPEQAELACWRRLYYECHTAAMTDLRTRLERKEDDGPRKLLMPERVERLERAKKSLVGITIDSQLEPAHRLVDAAVQQAEDSTLSISPSRTVFPESPNCCIASRNHPLSSKRMAL